MYGANTFEDMNFKHAILELRVSVKKKKQKRMVV